MFQFKILLFVSLLFYAELGHSLRCLSCVARLQPWMCTTVRICRDQDQNCGVRKYRSLNGEILYDMDCVTDKICQLSQTSNASTIRSNGKDAEVLCDECCQGEFCNNRGCDSQGYPGNRGPVCFNCVQARDPSKCSELHFCRRDELCAVFQEEMFGISYFSSRCSAIFDCSIQQPAAIGKRQTIKKRCGSCCNTDFCNSNCDGEIIPRPTGGAGNQGTQATSKPMTLNPDDHKEFVLIYPNFNNQYNMYVFMATTTPGVVLVEVPFLSMKKNMTLNVGRNYLSFSRTLMTRDGGYLDHKGIYLNSSVPLSVSVMFYYRDNGGNVNIRNEYTGGYMALPVSRLGKQYVVVGYYYPQFTIAAIHDNTTIRIQLQLPSSNRVIIAGQFYQSGSVITKTMNRLDTLCITAIYIVTGTTIFADKDIAVVSGDYFYSYDSTTVQYLSPVSQWGTSFFIPSLPKIPRYYIYLQMAEIRGNTTVNITSTHGTQQYQVRYHQYKSVTIDSPPVYIESRKPIQVTVQTYYNSSLPATMLWIPSTNHYKNSYLVTNPNSITPGYFDDSLLVVLPTNKQNGLLLDGMRVHSIEINTTLSVNSSSYAFMTISMDGGYHVITHSDPSVKFGAFVFGNGRLQHRYGYSHYGYPAGIQ